MPAPIITPIAPQIITVNTAYRLVVPISNITAADTVRITGSLEGFEYDFDLSLNAAVITGTPNRKLSAEWHIVATNPDGMAIADIVYDIVDNLPVITDIGRLRIARGIETRLVIPVTGQIGQGSVRGPIIGLVEDIVNNEIVLTGEVPEDANFDLGGMGSLVANVSNTGGADRHTFPFDLVSALAMPTNLRVSSTRAGIVTAQWNAVAAAASYEVRQGILGEWRSTTSTSFQFPIVYEAGIYDFYARALDAHGLGGHVAGPVSHTVVRVVPPGAVASFTVSVSGTTITVSWTPPSDTGGGAITGYRITGSLPTVTPSASERSRTFTDLDDGTYFFRIEAQNSAGYGPQSSQERATVFTTAPDAPRLSGFLSGTSARLSWNTPNDNGRTIQYYEVSIGGGSWFSVGNTNSYTRALSVGTTSFRVRAVNEKGASSASNSVSITRATVPSAPSLSASLSGSQASLGWTTPFNGGSAITYYDVSINGGSWFGVGFRNSYFINLNPGTTSFRVRAGNSIGAGSASNSASVTYTPVVRPSAPTGLSVRVNSSGNPVVRWSRVSGADSYDVRWNLGTGTETINSATTSTSYTIPRRAGDDPIQVWVRARNSAGISGWSYVTE